ncbi:PEP-CTERM sorting domain-containing protein [Massilia consociata]|uniref:PEP-CTERM sorting domain-containing protein n=1 Tax=Massilia consociata TaxID=760117 RepID=A0ABV6FCR2_9BURK
MSVGTYNGFNIYSLDLLKQCAQAGDARCLPSSGLPVQSSPGQIADQAVILGGSNGMTNFRNSPFPNGAAVDEVFLTPRGNQGASYTMSDPGGQFAGDRANTWEISLDLLRNYLNGNDLVFLFDNNQQGSGANQWINVWGQARIIDGSGNTVNGLCFELSTGSGCSAPVPSAYVPVVGNFCVDKTTGASYNVGTARNATSCGTNGYFVENNLGTNNAEFAAYNQTLSNAVQNLIAGNYFLSVDVRYTGNNAGAEQLWICSDCTVAGTPPGQVPEPATLPLMLLGFMAAGAMARKSRKQH